MITQHITIEVIGAQVSDDCRVEILAPEVQDAPVALLFPGQAREFAAEVLQAADEAEKASAELLHPVAPSKFDRPAVIAPDCRDGKHQACIGDAWSTAEDAPAPCDCSCHTITEAAAA